MVRNNLFYSREMKAMGVVNECKDSKYVEMIDVMNGKRLLYLSVFHPLESVNYIVIDNKIIMTDLMVLNDVSNSCKYVVEVNNESVIFYKTNNLFNVSEKSFYDDLTMGKQYSIIKGVEASWFERLSSNEFVMFLSNLNGGTGTIEVGGNLREIY